MEFVDREEMFGDDHERCLVVSGGVARNMFIRGCLDHVAGEMGWRTVYPPPELCTDNGVMIAWDGAEKWRRGVGVVPWQQVMGVPVVTREQMGTSLVDQVEKAHIKCRYVKLPWGRKKDSNSENTLEEEPFLMKEGREERRKRYRRNNKKKIDVT